MIQQNYRHRKITHSCCLLVLNPKATDQETKFSLIWKWKDIGKMSESRTPTTRKTEGIYKSGCLYKTFNKGGIPHNVNTSKNTAHTWILCIYFPCRNEIWQFFQQNTWFFFRVNKFSYFISARKINDLFHYYALFLTKQNGNFHLQRLLPLMNLFYLLRNAR